MRDLRRPPAVTHLLVDLDGTISDSSPGIGASLRQAFERCGYPPLTDDDVRSMIGPPFEVSFPAHGVPDHDIQRVALAFRERYETIGLFENHVYDGVVAMLDSLAERGIRLAIATAKPEPTAVRIIDHFGLTDRFELIAGATFGIGSERRSKASVIEYALRELGLDPGPHVVMLGDRDHDVHGAAEHGLACVGVGWGFGSPEELTNAGVTVIVNDPADVADAVVATYRLPST